MPATLYICATPIGNLEDITLRVLRILKEADLIAAEDTRNTLRLLNHFEIKNTLTSYHEFNKYDKADELVGLLLEGKSIALVTDAGTPAISDPGEVIVRKAIENGIPVTSLPGACALIDALTISGQPTRRFAFEAFLPRDKKERTRVLTELKNETRTIIIYEAPHHLKNTLKDLFESLGDREISLCRELTKIHEERLIFKLSEAINYYNENDPRGEYVLVIRGKSFEELETEARASWENMELNEHMQLYLDRGMDKKTAMKQVAKDRGISKREVYNLLLEK
ncbi:MAG: 16S rRNA (cytidine(1402)-2'-O)-methyltransferase [Lachnospiraceae bacterium]|nr:16S rRNA (cytidine(1402)-2'-O)-methyltransferase [Lachnospiraceae bacterium]